MPFMKGQAPIRRTTSYLEAGKIILRETVKIFAIHYTRKAENHKGAREFAFWHLDQIQYKNPNVQCLILRDLTPSPFIRIYFENTKDVIINLNCRERLDILDHLTNFAAVCKTKMEISQGKKFLLKDNLSLFGYGCNRHCICEILGQVPCPRLVKLPKIWKNHRKFTIKKLIVPYYYSEKGLDDYEDE